MNILKRISIVFVAALLCCLSVFNFSAFASVDNDVIDDWDVEFTAGDLNSDTEITTDDLLLLRKYLAGLISETDILFVAADINNDEAVTTEDLLELRKIIAGLV